MRVRSLAPALAAAAALLPAVAAASAPITSGEFRNTAHTLEKGGFVLHPILPSTYGISDRMDVKSSILGLIAGPNANLEIGLLDADGNTLSVEPSFSSDWGFSTPSAGLMVNDTLMMGDNRLNLRLGGNFVQVPNFVLKDNGELVQEGKTVAVGVPLAVGYDLVKSDQVEWRFTGNVNLVGLVDSPSALLGFTWNKAMAQKFRLALGAAAYVGQNPLAGLPGGFFDDIKVLVLPLPQLELWWRF